MAKRGDERRYLMIKLKTIPLLRISNIYYRDLSSTRMSYLFCLHGRVVVFLVCKCRNQLLFWSLCK